MCIFVFRDEALLLYVFNFVHLDFISSSLFSAEITGNALLKGKFVEINGEKYVQFISIDVDVDVKDYNVRVDKLFPDKNLSELLR